MFFSRLITDHAKRFTEQDSGAAATEYAICLALIVGGCIVAVTALGMAVSTLFPDLAQLIP